MPHLVILRSAFEQQIDLDEGLATLGLVARIEHLLGRLEEDLSETLWRRAAAEARLPAYETRLGEAFPLQAELGDRVAKLAVLDADLAGNHEATAMKAA